MDWPTPYPLPGLHVDKNLDFTLKAEFATLIQRAYEAGYRDGFSKASDASASNGTKVAGSAVGPPRADIRHGSLAPAIFRCLGSHPGLTAGEIVARTGLKAGSVRSALKRMVSDGYLTDSEGKYHAAGHEDGKEPLGRRETVSEAVLSFLDRAPGSRLSDIVQGTRHKESSVRSVLHRLKVRGSVEVSWGQWRIKAAGQ